jgi:hypothetical protein
MRDLGGGKQRGTDLGADVPDFPEGNNPSGGQVDHPFYFDGDPVTPAVARVRAGGAAAHGEGHGQGQGGGGK